MNDFTHVDVKPFLSDAALARLLYQFLDAAIKSKAINAVEHHRLNTFRMEWVWPSKEKPETVKVR